MFDDESMLTYLAMAPLWCHATGVPGSQTHVYSHMAATRLIADIPKALDWAGIKLREMNIRCDPVRKHYIKGMPSDEEMQRLLEAFA